MFNNRYAGRSFQNGEPDNGSMLYTISRCDNAGECNIGWKQGMRASYKIATGSYKTDEVVAHFEDGTWALSTTTNPTIQALCTKQQKFLEDLIDAGPFANGAVIDKLVHKVIKDRLYATTFREVLNVLRTAHIE